MPTQSIIEEEISSILRIVELADQFIEAEEAHKAHGQNHEVEVARLTGFAAQHATLQGKMADTMAHASGALVLLAAFLQKMRDVLVVEITRIRINCP